MSQPAATRLGAPSGYRPQITPKVLQAKPASRKLPAAPPVYQPHPIPLALQAKLARSVVPRSNQPVPRPVAPAPYRPQPTPKVLQKKVTSAPIRSLSDSRIQSRPKDIALRVASRSPLGEPASPRINAMPQRYQSAVHQLRTTPSLSRVAMIQRKIDPNDVATITSLSREALLERMRKPVKEEEPGELATAWLNINAPKEQRGEGKDLELWIALIKDAGLDDEEEFEDEEDEVPSIGKMDVSTSSVQVKTVSGKVAATGMVQWLKQKGYGGATNYTVAVLANDDLVISKVGGVTAKTKAIATMKGEIETKGYHKGRKIYLAQKFSKDGASNHAEMCILAAAFDLGVNYMLCTGPHCPFCAETMKAYKVELGNGTGGKGQVGWSHPFHRLFYGTQTSGKEEDKLAELKSVHEGKTTVKAAKLTGAVMSDPKGARTLWFG